MYDSYLFIIYDSFLGRISRFLANKCTIASRIDAFSETPNTIFGEKLKEQVEERLKLYEDGMTHHLYDALII